MRGLRNGMDYSYEENIAQVNRRLNPEMETLYLRGDDTAISSSLVRELLAFGRDIGDYVPGSVWKTITSTRQSKYASSIRSTTL